MSDVHPDPEQPSTCTGTTVAALATPARLPIAVPAQWVPWPLQSSASSVKSEPPLLTKPGEYLRTSTPHARGRRGVRARVRCVWQLAWWHARGCCGWTRG